MAKRGRLELGDSIYGHNRFIFNHCDVHCIWPAKQSNSWKTQNKGYYAVQGHRGRYATNRKPVCDFLLVINTDNGWYYREELAKFLMSFASGSASRNYLKDSSTLWDRTFSAAEQIFMKMLLRMCLWTRKSPVNFGDYQYSYPESTSALRKVKPCHSCLCEMSMQTAYEK